MTRAAEAMTRLGHPIVDCVWCDAHVLLREAYRVMGYKRGTKGEALANSFRWFCSLTCVTDRISSDAHHESDDWFNCCAMNRFESWSKIGTFNLIVFDGWRWNDTGESRWIDENLLRLRAAGENL